MERSGSKEVQNKKRHQSPGNLEEDRPGYIKTIFSRLAPRYDTGNTLVSFGTHLYYKKYSLEALQLEPENTLLDLCTGTGDMALLAARKVNPSGIYAVDFSPQMIELARKRAEKKGIQINFLVGDVTELPFENETFDRAVMSFGLRNIPDKKRVFKEVYRVLRKGGRFAVLEFSRPEDALLPAAYRFYLHWLVPLLGWVASCDFQAYRYLADSIEDFPPRIEIEKLAIETGFQAHSKGLLAGMLTLYNFVKS